MFFPLAPYWTLNFPMISGSNFVASTDRGFLPSLAPLGRHIIIVGRWLFASHPAYDTKIHPMTLTTWPISSDLAPRKRLQNESLPGSAMNSRPHGLHGGRCQPFATSAPRYPFRFIHLWLIPYLAFKIPASLFQVSFSVLSIAVPQFPFVWNLALAAECSNIL